jgi:hypothetical protein
MVSGKRGAGREIEGPEDIPEKDVWVVITTVVLGMRYVRRGLQEGERAVEDGGRTGELSMVGEESGSDV